MSLYCFQRLLDPPPCIIFSPFYKTPFSSLSLSLSHITLSPSLKDPSIIAIMVVLSQPILDSNLGSIKTCKPAFNTLTIPIIDLSKPNAKTLIVDACKRLGFFKVINHGISMDFLNKLETEVVEFFKLSQLEKEKSGPPNPFGYGSKMIGRNGDVGWVEYLLFSTNPQLFSRNPNPVVPETLW